MTWVWGILWYWLAGALFRELILYYARRRGEDDSYTLTTALLQSFFAVPVFIWGFIDAAGARRRKARRLKKYQQMSQQWQDARAAQRQPNPYFTEGGEPDAEEQERIAFMKPKEKTDG